MNQRPLLIVSFLLVVALASSGCVGAPEHCHGCLAALADAGGFDLPGSDLSVGDRGGTGGGGGGGATGGAATGGAATGGAATGGAATGGAATGGAATGGTATGGADTGGRGTGGAATGGRGTGGAATGGAATGGRGTGGAATGGAAGAAVDPDLVLWYKFDETAGTTAADAAMFGGTARNGTLTSVGAGTAGFSTTRQVGTRSLNLTSSSNTVGAYVSTLPSPGLMTLAPGAITIACWVYVRTNQMWQRVFDFGVAATTPQVYMFLSTNYAMTTPNSPRFGITTGSSATEQAINMTTPATLSLNQWHHLVVVLPAGATYTGTLYIDGAVAGTNNAMTLHPSNLGATGANFLGRSQFTDPYFNGQIDDFRIYRRALTAAEVTSLYMVR
ncbi:MAG: LamG domain-containing protein [Pseudomonadota bacterium]